MKGPQPLQTLSLSREALRRKPALDAHRVFGLKQLHAETYDKTIGGKQIQWLSMSFDTDANAWKNILKKEQFTWPQISNLKSTKQDPTFNNWKLHWIPAFFVISPKGEIVGSAITADGLRDILVPLIK